MKYPMFIVDDKYIYIFPSRWTLYPVTISRFDMEMALDDDMYKNG